MILAACQVLIAIGRAIVPVAFRDDWWREWQAELFYLAETRASRAPGVTDRLDLLKRCAGALVAPGKEVGPGELWLGNPAKKVRMLSDAEIEALYYSAQHYVRLKDDYLAMRAP